MQKTIALTVDGADRAEAVPPRLLLSDFLRERCGRASVKKGCGHEGRCGACTVLVEGRARKSCLMLAVQADGKAVTTAAGLGRSGRPHPLETAFRRYGAAPCGHCTGGMLTAAADLLDHDINPDADRVRAALAGIGCRCEGRARIVEAVLAASAMRHGKKPPPPSGNGIEPPPGRGPHFDDHHGPDCLHLCFVRAHRARVRIGADAFEAARAMEGVTHALAYDAPDGAPPRPGAPLAAVLAEDPYLAADAVEALAGDDDPPADPDGGASPHALRGALVLWRGGQGPTLHLPAPLGDGQQHALAKILGISAEHIRAEAPHAGGGDTDASAPPLRELATACRLACETGRAIRWVESSGASGPIEAATGEG